MLGRLVIIWAFEVMATHRLNLDVVFRLPCAQDVFLLEARLTAFFQQRSTQILRLTAL